MRLASSAVLTLLTLAVSPFKAFAGNQTTPAPSPLTAEEQKKHQISAPSFPKHLSHSATDLIFPNPLDKTQVIPIAPRLSQEKQVREIQVKFINADGEPVEGKTQTDFILGELQLKPGQIFNQELLNQDIWKLKRLDLFSKVKASLVEDNDGTNIIYELQEKRFSYFTFGGGNSGDIGLFGKIGYRQDNLNGLQDKLRLDAQISGKDLFQYRAGFTSPYRNFQPQRLGYNFDIFRSRDFSSTFNKDIDFANGDDIREGRFGGSIGLLKSFNGWDSRLALNYTRISIRDRDWDIKKIDEKNNPLSLSGTGIDDLITLSLGISLDRRNKISNPTQGSLISFSTEQSIPVGLGQVLMNRLKANYTQYVPVQFISKKPLDEDSPLTELIAFNLQAGTIIGDVIPAETFNLGGLNSVRGYGSAELASGRSFVLGSVEYRFPIFKFVGGVIFADFGSDLGTGDSILGLPGPVRDKPGTGFAYGIGVRVQSPLGLLRGDLGINDQGNIRLEITTGQKF